MQPFPGRFRSRAIRKFAMVGNKFSHRGDTVGAAMPVGIDDNESGMPEFDAGDRIGKFVPPVFNLRRVGGSDFLPIPYAGRFVPLARPVPDHLHRKYGKSRGGESKSGIEIGLPVVGGSGITTPIIIMSFVVEIFDSHSLSNLAEEPFDIVQACIEPLAQDDKIAVCFDNHELTPVIHGWHILACP
jgi:hypothetical protein